ncbi:MAG: hypothetical protein LUH19_00785 [Lachnospiraceae bacterium]|nr:hypothetical protein [Lachnospiraceae bacterium]
MSEKLKNLLTAGMVILFVIIIFATVGIYYETNDDRIIAEFLSGSMTGEPDAGAIYLNYLLSYPLMLLYRMTTGIPWYGIFLIGAHCMSLFVIMKSVLTMCETVKGTIGGMGLCVCLLLSDVYMLSQIQFTSTAALLAVAGYSCVISSKGSRKSQIIFLLMEIWAILLRRDSMLMIQPLGVAVLVGNFLGNGGYKEKIEWKKMGICACSVVAALFLGQIGNVIGYSSEEWKAYNQFNEASVAMFDYYGFPDYEEVRDILDKYGVTETEYAAYANYVMIEWDLSVECVQELAEYVQSMRAADRVNPGILFKEACAFLFSRNRLESNNLVGILWIGAILGCALIRKKEVILPFSLLAAARTAVWVYLIYMGRLPYRVTRPLLLGETVLLLLLLLNTWKMEIQKTGVRMLAGGMSVCFALWACITGQRQFAYAVNANSAQEIMFQSFLEVKEYCQTHSENRYILDDGSFSNCVGPALRTAVDGEVNYIYSGGWYSNSPNMVERIGEYLGELDEQTEDFYLIIYDWSGERNAQDCGVTVQYLMEKTLREPEVADILTLANGGTYLVLRF